MNLAEILVIITAHFCGSYLFLPYDFLKTETSSELGTGVFPRSVLHTVWMSIAGLILFSSGQKLWADDINQTLGIVIQVGFFAVGCFLICWATRVACDRLLRLYFKNVKPEYGLKHLAFTELMILSMTFILYDGLFILG